MKCPFCGFGDTKVLDSRPAGDGSSIRRRRECVKCAKRFTTYERLDELPLMVVKKDGRREMFDRPKLLSGIAKACQKRPISMDHLDAAVNRIERRLKDTAETEVNSRDIGELVMELLRGLDEVAYVRFASVYREFHDARSFVKEIEKLMGVGTGEKTE
ncbi:ribonucleotide reductase transcriptional regulator NrdR [Desulfocucumis palustris]|uniref:Transcriptional repressor NrdR n=1 Tax=Desulfocucumis palustris TaxID=1898651 RepID=A0A2L2XB12_9FIRM|nr:transcriptional regulator NrdR [Desulfocucumis palustris]GBF33262.1 ribonucleotide reductase transcriptional regulator NrdR [Desulfocucumis palustris]